MKEKQVRITVKISESSVKLLELMATKEKRSRESQGGIYLEDGLNADPVTQTAEAGACYE